MLEFEEKGFFTKNDGTQSNHILPEKPHKFLDHVVVPKRNKSGYVLFIGDQTKIFKEKFPDMKITEIMKKAASQWSELKSDQKKVYEEGSIHDKKRYETQLNDLLTKGYFIMEDGSKSTDHQAKKRIKRVVPKALVLPSE